MPAVEQVDPELLLTDWLFTLVGSGEVPALVGWSVGTRVEPGVTPVNAVRVRLVGGVEEQRVADRPRLDLRFWGDGSAVGEATVKQVARAVFARIRRDFRSTVVMDPTPMPDPYDQTRVLVMGTVELLTRGVQL